MEANHWDTIFPLPVTLVSRTRRVAAVRLMRVLMPAAALTGMIVMLLCDVISKLPVSYTHLDVYKRQIQCTGDCTISLRNYGQFKGDAQARMLTLDAGALTAVSCVEKSGKYQTLLAQRDSLLTVEQKYDQTLDPGYNPYHSGGNKQYFSVYSVFHVSVLYNPAAVSYTHLDVYKRQPLKTVSACKTN